MSKDLIPASEYHCPFTKDMDKDMEYFCYQYSIDKNPQLAAERCGISIQMARKYLRDPNAKKAIDDIRSKVMSRCELHLEDILNEIKRIAFFDVKGVVDDISPDGDVKSVPWEDVDGRALAEVRVTETKSGRVITMQRPHRKIDALKILLDYATGANNNQTNIQVNINEVKQTDPEQAMDAFARVMEGAILSDGKKT